MSVTPYMSLLLPTVSVTLGPTYATENNTAFTTVDSHDHTSGKGIPVPSAGIGINADLPFNGYNATTLRSSRYTPQGSPLALVTDVNCAYFSGVDFWVNDGSGNQIQLTAGGALNAASIGGIGGDYTTSTASVFYTSATKTFTFWQNTNKSALMDIGSILLRRVDNTSSAAITIRPDTSLSSGYTLTLPTAVPGSLSFVAIDSSGNLSFVNSLASLALSGSLAVGTTLGVTGVATLSSSATVGTTLGVTGLSTLSGGATITGITGTGSISLLPTDVTNTLGDATHNFTRLYLDNGATDGGELVFNAGGSGLKSTASGGVLNVITFTNLSPASPNSCTLGDTTNTWSGLVLGTNIGSGTPNANELYADLIPKAWANTASGGTLNAGVNLTVGNPVAGTYNYTFKTNMANANYSVVGGIEAFTQGTWQVQSKTTSGFSLRTYNSSGTQTQIAHGISVFGVQ